MEEIRLEEGERGGCNLTMGYSALEEGEPEMVMHHELVASACECDVVFHSFHPM
jgi:hypothetical protein